MVVIAEDELQRVFAGLKFEGRFGLTLAEVLVVVVGRDRRGRIFERLVDQDVVVTGIGLLCSGRRDLHTLKAHLDGDWARDFGAVFRFDEEDFGRCR